MVQAPSFILPRDAGEERGGGLNRLNILNVGNNLNDLNLRGDIHLGGFAMSYWKTRHQQ